MPKRDVLNVQIHFVDILNVRRICSPTKFLQSSLPSGCPLRVTRSLRAEKLIGSLYKHMSVTTKTGDDGKSRWNNRTVDKDSPLLEVVGTLDELQSVVEDENIQRDLYGIMSTLSTDVSNPNLVTRIEQFEKEIEKLEKELKPINGFLIFKNEEARKLNWVRTVCRRAERRLVSLNKIEKIDPNILIYINRLSDYLFMLARKKEE